MTKTENIMAKEQSNNKSSDFVARRRIIKGLTATPVIYTLTNGSALALTSSHQCITNMALESAPDCSEPTQVTPPDSFWQWDQITNTTTGETRFCVRHVEEDTPLTNPSSFSTTGYDWRFTDSSAIMHHSFIDGSGAPAMHAGNPLTASCAASFM